MEAYCLKCKVKREITEPIADFNKKGTPVTRGTCSVCGTRMYRMGRTKAHEGLQPPKIKEELKRKGNLVIVESPAKAKTVSSILGKEYQVKASVGHVRDLLRSQLSVDVENGFMPKYRVPNDKRSIVKELKEKVKNAEQVFLATDPDREGEAIAWHLQEATNIEEQQLKRVVFHEITKPAILEAFLDPRKIDMDLVNAQQARRILDRLVGYNLTPLLWQKVRGRLSAGRVQSVTLRLIVEREREIENFIPKEYWTIDGEFKSEGSTRTFIARLLKINNIEPNLPTEDIVEQLKENLEKAEYIISKIKRGLRHRKPYPPFITSTLQQQASLQLGFRARRTMQVAQQLYEGVDIGEGGASGLITYMRTDSLSISPIAVNDVRKYIEQRFGEKFLPKKPVFYRTKAATAQEAHEATRPTSVRRTPQNIKHYLTRDQYRLYELIWKRFISSQMESAVYDTISVDINGTYVQDNYLFRVSGSSIKFQGFLVLYEEAQDKNGEEKSDKKISIPPDLKEGQPQELIQLISEQHFTQPPPRFTEASLVQALEEYGIGRPSTYAPIISTIQIRGYVERNAKRLIPTEIGFLVNDLLVEYFPGILEVNFTAEMERDLDSVASGKKLWGDVLEDFYNTFEPKLISAREKMPEVKSEPERIGRECPDCGHDLIVRWGRYGKFISCSNYPECKYTEPFLEKIGVICPKDGGELVERKTRRGRIFYGCSNYPNCDFSSWKRPISAKCPSCDGLLVQKSQKEAQCIECEDTFAIDSLLIEETA